jgi:hypothetical protein
MRTFAKSVVNLFKRLVQALLTEKVFVVLIALVAILILVGTVFYATWEKLPYIDSFLYSVMVITTVGASDFSANTVGGKLFTACYALLGTGLFVGLITGLAQAIIIQEHNKEKKN